MINQLSVDANADDRNAQYQNVRKRISSLLDGKTDWIAAMATVSCELHQAFGYFDWTGFYRVTAPEQLMVGPYQGSHGCLHIAFSQGVCGAAARTQTTQLVPDVEQFPGHIACSSTTKSEIVVPIVTPEQKLLAVLDVDSDTPAAFNAIDQKHLEALGRELGRRFKGHRD